MEGENVPVILMIIGIVILVIMPIFLHQDKYKESKLINGTIVMNGTEEWYALQYMDYNKRQLTQYYELQNVIINNFCDKGHGYINDITPESFKLQCCNENSSCNSYIIMNKNIPEVGFFITKLH